MSETTPPAEPTEPDHDEHLSDLEQGEPLPEGVSVPGEGDASESDTESDGDAPAE